MKNFIDELEEMNISEMDVTLEKLIDLYEKGRITTNQYIKILIHNLGEETVINILTKTIEESYSKDLLSKEIPEGLREIYLNGMEEKENYNNGHAGPSTKYKTRFERE